MGGIYGTIDSREAFFRVLEEARALTARISGGRGDDPTLATLARQLDVMARFRDLGRAPTPAERAHIQVGVIAVRELDADRPDESGELARKLHALGNYVDDWPSDEAAASATDADYWARFGL
jgi:hypothetical protein